MSLTPDTSRPKEGWAPRQVWLPRRPGNQTGEGATDLAPLTVLRGIWGGRPRLERGVTRTLRELEVWADVVVVSQESVREWRDVYGTVIHAALDEGREMAA